MDERTRELIAIGSSIGAHCQPCLTYHVARAKDAGIEEGEIREAIAVGQMIEKGATSAMERFVAGIFADSTATAAGCCGDEKTRGKNCCG